MSDSRSWLKARSNQASWCGIVAITAAFLCAFATPGAQPSGAEQYALEILNDQREAAGIQPLAWSGVLGYTAEQHTVQQVTAKTFEHSPNLASNISAAGWQYLPGVWGFFENMAGGWTWGVMPTGHLGQQYYVDALNAQLNGSPSHYAARMDPQAMRVGIGYNFGHYHSPDSAFVTEHFGYNQAVALTGSIFSDRNGNHRYNVGEGTPAITVKATARNTGQVFSTVSMEAGGYELPLHDGQFYFVELVNPHGYHTPAVGVRMQGKNERRSIDLSRQVWVQDQAVTSDDKDISGGPGDDILIGGPHANVLRGRTGVDRLAGGGGPDIFVAERNGSQFQQFVTVTDFQPGTDRIDMHSFFQTYSEVTSAMRDTAEGVVIMLPSGAGDWTLLGIYSRQLRDYDFITVPSQTDRAGSGFQNR